MVDKTTAIGTKIFRSTDGATYTWIEGAFSIGRPGNAKPRIDVTDLNSTSREYLDDLPDSSSVGFQIYIDHNDPVHQALIADDNSSVTRSFKIEFPEPNVATVTTYAFDGFVQNFSGTNAVSTAQAASPEIQLSAKPVITHNAVAEA